MSTRLRTFVGRSFLSALVILAAAWPADANRKFTSGFELQSTTNHVEWSTVDTTNTAGAISTSVFRTGAASYCVTSVSSGTAKGQGTMFDTLVVDGVDYFLRAYIRIAALPNATTSIMGFGTGETAITARVYLNTNGTMSVQVDGDTVVGPGSTVLSLDTWYRIELRIRRHAATPNAGSDQVELKIDGNTESGATSSAQSMATGGYSRAHIGANLRGTNDTASSINLCFDDVAINDSVDAGAGAQISWPGAGSVATLFPNAPGEFGQDVTATGDTPAASFWESLDDGPATGTVDTTDHVTFNADTTNWTGTGDRLAVAMGALPDADSVTLVATGLRWANLSGSVSSYATSIQIANGGTKPTDTTISVSHATLWWLNSTSSARSETIAHGTSGVAPVYYANPSGSAWSESDVNDLQVLVRATDGSPAFMITSLWAHVEYIPGEGGEEPSGDGAGLLLLGVQ